METSVVAKRRHCLPYQPERGYTLVELLVAATIAGLIASLLFSVWTFAIGFSQRGGAQAEAQQVGRIALATIVRELRESPAGADTVAIWSAAEGAPADALGFLSARREEGGRPFITDTFGDPAWHTAVYYIFDRSRGVLHRVAQRWEGSLTLPQTTEGRVVARSVKEVRFAREGDLVFVTLRVSAGRGEITLNTAVASRN